MAILEVVNEPVISWLIRVFTFKNILIAFWGYLLFGALYQVIFYRFFHPLKDFPGPFWWSVTRLPLAWTNFWDTELDSQMKMIKKYGKIVRISPTLLLVSTAKTLPLIYHRTAKKTPHYTLFSFGPEGTIFHMWEHADYAARAKTVAGIYSARSRMPKTEATIDKHSTAWTEKLSESFAANGECFDIAKWVQYLTMDIIIDLLFGEEHKLGFVENGKDMLGLCYGFKIALPFYGIVCRMYPFWTWLNTTIVGRIFDYNMLHGDFTIGRQNRFVDRVVKCRLGEIREGKMEEKKWDDMLQAFIDARTPEGTPLSTTTLRAEVGVVLIAGADNTTAAICTTIFHLLKSPKALFTVLEELEAAKVNGQISSIPQNAEILKFCPFYVACVKESHRLNPSLPSFLPRYSSSDPNALLTIGDRVIPPETEVASNPWITHRDQELYGSDAEEWIPERWLDPERAKLFEKYNFTFGYGGRPCLGKQLGMISALKAPLILLNTFKTEMVLGSKKPKLCIRADFSYWENLMIRLEKRRAGDSLVAFDAPRPDLEVTSR